MLVYNNTLLRCHVSQNTRTKSAMSAPHSKYASKLALDAKTHCRCAYDNDATTQESEMQHNLARVNNLFVARQSLASECRHVVVGRLRDRVVRVVRRRGAVPLSCRFTVSRVNIAHQHTTKHKRVHAVGRGRRRRCVVVAQPRRRRSVCRLDAPLHRIQLRRRYHLDESERASEGEIRQSTKNKVERHRSSFHVRFTVSTRP